jgi:uncharacterized protein involved in outer membrane biogenesis
MRILRIVGIALSLLAALIIVLLLAIKLFVNPNDYRGRVEQAVQRSTGRQLQLSGELKLSVFPWIALELGPASLGNPTGFPREEPFATVQHVALRVRLLPLLARRLQVGRIEVERLNLRLQKNAAGQGNWQDFGRRDPVPAAAAADSPARGRSPDAGMLQSIGGVSIKDSRVSYQDTIADHITLTIGGFAPATTFPVDLALTLSRGAGAQPIPVSARLQLNVDPSSQSVHISPLEMKFGDSILRGEAAVTHLDTQTMNLDPMQLQGVFTIDGVLKDLAKTDRLSGRGHITMDLTAQGGDAAQLTRSLNGHVTASVNDGAVEGVDLWFEINRAMALIQKQPMPAGNGSGRTKFDTFKASAELRGGVATTRDLSIVSQNLRIAGQGSSNLVTDQISYQLVTTVLKDLPTAANAAGESLADIPLTITGTLSDPQVRPDLEAMAKAQLLQELDRHHDDIQQKLQSQLKNLFK